MEPVGETYLCLNVVFVFLCYVIIIIIKILIPYK